MLVTKFCKHCLCCITRASFADDESLNCITKFCVFQVSLLTWEQGDTHPCQYHSACVDPSSATLRNPFPDKKWKKFHISRFFSSSNAACKIHSVDVHMVHGEINFVDKWLVALSLGSGQTRNMALDRYI